MTTATGRPLRTKMTGCPPEMRVTRASGAASRKPDAAAVLAGPLLPALQAGLTGLPSPPARAAVAGGTPRQADYHHDSPALNPVRHPARRGLGHLT